jgi:phage-related protein
MNLTFVNGQMGMNGSNVSHRIVICDNRYSNASDFKTAMNGVQLVYELATPQTIQLTPTEVKTLLGENNIFSNCGDVSVKVEPSFPLIINQVAEWLHSASGYARLEDTYEPDYYRMAYYSESVSFENLFNEAGKATLNFICKPQRYLKSGETSISFTEEGTIQNGTRFSSSPVLKVTTDNTQGSVSIGNHTITIKAGAGTDPITIDCELQDAWSGTTNKNPFIILTDGEFPVIDPGTQTITFDGGVQSVEVTPRWWTV